MQEMRVLKIISNTELSDIMEFLLSEDHLMSALGNVLCITCAEKDESSHPHWNVNFNGSIMHFDFESIVNDNEFKFIQLNGVLKALGIEVHLSTDNKNVLMFIHIYFDTGIAGLGEVLNPIMVKFIEENIDEYFAYMESLGFSIER